MQELEGFKSGEKELLRMFQKDINRIPVLTREEEALAARQARAGDQAAADLLIESNLRFVLKVVFRFWYPGLPLMDLIAEGCMGLLRALQTFDPDMGFRFLSYAEPAIRQQVQEAIRLHYLHQHFSLDEPAYDEGGENTLKDLLFSDEPGADETVFNKQARRMLAVLNRRERTVIVLRFWHDLTLEEIGLRIGLDKERVRQIKVRSLRKMHWSFRGSFGADHGKTLVDTYFGGCKP
jgi:RNA polymerase sigma factor (sigma-70 family)